MSTKGTPEGPFLSAPLFLLNLQLLMHSVALLIRYDQKSYIMRA